MKTVSLRSLAANTLMLGVGRWVAQILNVFALPLALLYVTPSDFGLFSILQIASLVGGVMISFGLHNAFMARFSNADDDSGNLLGRVLSQQVILGSAALSIMIFLSYPVATWLDFARYVALLQALLVGEYFANMILIVNRWQILANYHWQLSLVALVRSVTQLVLLLIFVAWQRYGLLGLIIADAGSKVTSFAITYFLTRDAWKFEFRSSDIGLVFKFGLPSMPDPIFFWLIVFMPLYVLKLHGLLALAGAVSLGWRLMSPVELLGNSLASGAAGKMVDEENHPDDLQRWYFLSVVVIILSAITIMFLSPEIIIFFFDPEYYQAVEFLPYVAAGVIFLAFYYFEWISLSTAGKAYGLSVASGSGVLMILAGLSVAGRQINSSIVTLMFALGFLAMWSVARMINTRQRFGRWHYLSLGVFLTTLISFRVLSFSPSLHITIMKILGLGGIAAVSLAAVLFLVMKSLIAHRRLSASFLSVPNYAEIAKKVQPSSAILDVGCSEGFFLGEIQTTGLRVGTDIDFIRLRAGKLERPQVNFVNADAYNLPFRQNSFDTVVLIGVLPYLESPVATLKEIHRVLTKPGRIELSSVNAYWLYRLLNIYNWKHRFRFYTSSELKTMMKDAGFAVDSIYSRGRLLALLVGNLFFIPNYFDRWRGNGISVLGPYARWTRQITNPLIQWEYDHHHGEGCQFFVSGSRYD